MKRLLLIALTSLSIHAIAQTNTFPLDGNVGIGTISPAEKLTIAGVHGDTKLRLYSTGNGSDEPANLSLWASEPGWTYYGTGIGYNVNGSPYYGRIDNTRGSSYVRFLPDETKFEFQNTSGSYINAFTIKGNGNVGIGTTTPTEILETTGNIKASSGALISSISNTDIGGYLSLNNPTKTGNGQASMWRIYNMGGGYGNSLQFWAYDNAGCTSGGMCLPRFTILDSGNVGIGTATPAYKLDVNGELKAGGIQLVAYSPILFSAGDINHGIRYAGSYSNFANALLDGPVLYGYSGGALGVKQGATESIALRWTGTGNVGIGTQNPAYKLDVLGTIRAKEVLVNLDGGADFVFEKGYKLLPIEHVANYVQENKHLPDIPSANDMVKNGVSMGDMQVKLLQKVEEQTLYIIGLNNELQELKKQLKKLQKKK